MARVDFDPSTYNKTTLEYTMGAVYTSQATGYDYRYVKAGAALGVGDICVLGAATSIANKIVSVSPANTATAIGTGAMERCVGVAVGTIDSGSYGFILCRGFTATAKDAANGVSAATHVVPHASTDGNCANVTAGTNDQEIFGYALAAGSGGVVSLWVNC